MPTTPIAPLAPHHLLIFLIQVAVLLGMALCLGRLAVRLHMPPIVGELCAGVVLGPSLLGHLAPAASGWLLPHDAEQVHLIDAVGQLSLLLLVGITAAQLDARLLRKRGATAARVSLAGLLIPLAFGVGVGFALPGSLIPAGVEPTVFAMFLGVAMCVSAIPVIAKTLTDMGLLHRNVGQLTLVSGMVDDAVGWFLLSIVAAMATVGLDGGRIVVSVVSLVGFVIVAMTVGRLIVRGGLRLAARSPEPGPIVATTVIIVLAGSAATHALGMEPVFGAFVAGLLVGTSRVAAPATLSALRTVVLAVLAPIFLASAGLRIDLTALRYRDVLVAAVVVLAVAILGKFVGAYIGARASRLTHWEGLALGAGMNARGVVEVVVAMVGLRLGVLNASTYTIIVLVAIVTSLMAPPLLRFAMSRVEQSAEEELRRQQHAMWLSHETRRPSDAHSA